MNMNSTGHAMMTSGEILFVEGNTEFYKRHRPDGTARHDGSDRQPARQQRQAAKRGRGMPHDRSRYLAFWTAGLRW